MTDKLYTLSDLEALRERCAKVAEDEAAWRDKPIADAFSKAASLIRAIPLTTHTEEGTK